MGNCGTKSSMYVIFYLLKTSLKSAFVGPKFKYMTTHNKLVIFLIQYSAYTYVISFCIESCPLKFIHDLVLIKVLVPNPSKLGNDLNDSILIHLHLTCKLNHVSYEVLPVTILHYTVL